MTDQYGNYVAELPVESTPPAGWPGLTASGAPDFVNYSGPPTDSPPLLAHIVVDSDGRQWQFPPPSGPWQ